MIRKFRFEDAVEVLAAADGAERVAVGELGEDTDLVGVLELSAGRHARSRSDQAPPVLFGSLGGGWVVAGWVLVRCDLA